MKKLLTLTCILLAAVSSAQLKEGKIIFERTRQLPMGNLDIDPELAKQLPKTRTDQFELMFKSNQTLWQFLPSAIADENQTFQSGGAVIRFAGASNDIVFFDFEKEARIDQREVFDRTYLINDSIRKLQWKLTDETKTILNYTVRKALSTRTSSSTRMSMENGEMKRTTVEDTSTVVAWFTTEIPVPGGPEYQGQLPGMILELNIGDGQTVYTAVEVSSKVNTNKIKAPKDGKKITAAEFVKEREKMLDEMRGNFPNGRIRIQQ